MRAEIGQMTLDRTLAERAHLNSNIVVAINSAADAWGIRCLRYEIREYKYLWISWILSLYLILLFVLVR